MNGKFILENFEALAEAPGGVAHLRQTILELAVRGQLVAHGREASNGMRSRRSSKEISSDSSQRDRILPAHWALERIGSLGAPGDGPVSDGPFGSKLKTANYVDAPTFRVLRLGNIGVRELRNRDRVFINREHFESLEKYHLQAGDILVASLGNPTGRACVVPDSVLPAVHKADCFRVRVRPGIEPAFVVCALNSPSVLRRAGELNRGDTRGRITLRHLREAVVPIPPLSDQHRIVAKVDELMVLCDEFEERQTRRRTVRAAYVDSALDALATAEGPEAQTEAWGRVKTTWKDLVRTPTDVEKLRQTILDLAVRGRLVPQDPSDEPASVLLDRIAEEKVRLVAEGKLKKLKELPPIDEDEVPFELPDGWATASLQELGTVLGGGTPDKRVAEYWEGPVPWVSPKDMKVDYICDAQDHISEAAITRSAAKLIPVGSLLVVVRGMILAHSFPAALTTVAVAINQDMKAVIPVSANIATYLLLVAKGIKARVLSLVARSTHGTCKLPTDALFRLPIPIPPVAEQRRIVAKVDELMVLCDELESTVSREESTAELLAQAMTASDAPQPSVRPPAPKPLPPRPAGTTGPKAATPSNGSEPAKRKPDTLGEKAGEDFLSLTEGDRLITVWEVLFLMGPLPREGAVRQTASRLRGDGLASFNRLRKSGPLYEAIDEAIAVGLREGWFDRPKRGAVRAIESDAGEWTTDDWRTALTSSLDGVPTDREEAMRAAAEWARDHGGLEFQRLRKGGIILNALKTALNSAIRRQEIERVDTRHVRAF